MRLIKEVLKRIYYPIYVLCVFPKDYQIYSPNCNLEENQKSFFRQILDMLWWSILYGEYFDYYFLSGANLEKNELNQFIGGSLFRKLRDDKNFKIPNSKKGYSDILLLRDKLVFEKWMSYHGIPVATSLCTNLGKELKCMNFDFSKNYFIKAIDGQQGQDVYYVRNNKDLQRIEDNVRYIVQEELIQDDFINNIYSKSINTIRVITVRKKDEIEVICALHRFGTEESNKVDNWSAGGIIVPIDLGTGKYNKYGILSKKAVINKNSKIYHEVHPNSGVEWENKRVPMWEEVKEVACKAHSTLPKIVSVGWDIVVTSDGVLVLEGNDNWGISTVQSSLQGARKLIMETIDEV